MDNRYKVQRPSESGRVSGVPANAVETSRKHLEALVKTVEGNVAGAVRQYLDIASRPGICYRK